MMYRETVLPSEHSRPIGCYSPGVLVGEPGGVRWLFVSGQVSTGPDGSVDGPGDADRQIRVVFARLAAVLREAGGDLSHVVNLVIYLADVERDFAAVSAVRDEMLAGLAPASTLVEVARLAEGDCVVEVSATAALPPDEGGPR